MNGKKLCLKLLSGIFSCLMIPVSFPTSSLAADTPDSGYYPIKPIDTSVPTYHEYLGTHGESCPEDTEISIKGSDYSSAENGEFTVESYGSDDELHKDVLVWSSAEGQVTYDIEVPETGSYCIDMTYFPMQSGSSDIELSLTVDGSTPFDSASRVVLSRVWVNKKDIYTDSRGNQVRPSQIQDGMWLTRSISDPDGLYDTPLAFYLEKGHHTLGISSERAEFAIDTIDIRSPEVLPTYTEYVASLGGASKDTESALIRIEGENAAYKSDPTLCPTTDSTSCLASPADPVKVVYNTLGGGGKWKKAAQTAEWVIPAEEIGKGGWYRIGIKARQDQMRGFSSNRRLYIDGEVPCRELDDIKFGYDKDWQLVKPSADGKEIEVYLEGGSDHTIAMECVTGEIGEPLQRLDSAVRELDQCYRSILMITGPSPDKYTDYYVHEKIPTLTDDLARLSGELRSIRNDIEAISDSKGSEAAILENLAVILDKCVKHPLLIPDYMKQIKDSLTSVSAWLRDYRDQPLEVDYIELASEDKSFSRVKPKLWEAISFGIRSFFGSFFEDYTTLSDVEDKDALNVWVSLGRDQAQVVKELTENSFIPEYGIPVSVNLVSGGIIEASLAGKGPDVALFLGGEFPVNLAARGLIEDVSQFPDYAETAQRFQENAMTPYTFGNGIYGLPISQSWPMMFYRTDILSELGITSPPETWSELIDMLPALQRNYMSAGLVLPPNNISPATETGHTFAMLMLQKGQNYYNEDLSASCFNTVDAVQSFEEWTDFYTKYSFEQSYDPFSRFRTGEYPIVISNYTFFNQLSAAAPEIKGLWDFCQVPGTVQSDGSISHAANSNGSGAVIFSKVKNKEDAWKYISWFTDTETQVEYASQIEGLMGIMGRFDTANTEALQRLSWSKDELERLNAQRSQLTEIRIIPASYAVTRNIMNAFRETVNEGENPRDTLIWYNRDINDEIERKRREIEKYSG